MPASPILLNVRAPEPVKIDHIFAPYSPPPTNLIDRLRYWTEKQPEAIAYYYLVDGEDDVVHLTYAQLHERAQAIAARLIELRLCGERALLLYPPGLDYVEALFGCMFARVVPVPAYPPRRNRNMNRIQAISDDSAAKVALTVAEVSNRVVNMLDETPNLKQLTWLATDEIRNEEASQFKPVDVTGDTLALLQYTSGSTGDPKGVMITHANLMHNCFLICGAFEFSRLTTAVSWLPLYHDMGLLGGVLTPMFTGRPQT
ncbi:MAG: AMP-binding protein, partial [Planctomycetes bacterium]|nr:AMP-binding protein [Planctomycetota bacterium]